MACVINQFRRIATTSDNGKRHAPMHNESGEAMMPFEIQVIGEVK
jgi:hypothetical protein